MTMDPIPMPATRRRVLTILAACAPFSAPVARAARTAAEPSVWRGNALGAPASMTLLHPDRGHAHALIADCEHEIRRLEGIFSLFRAGSSLVQLNAAGELPAPALELVELLSFALELARRSGGAFDPTVQPLYRLYADHFAAPGAAPRGPADEAIRRRLRVVDHEAVELRADRIRLRRPGMAITLNGVAQGYLTDRIVQRLKAGGLDHGLVDLGEARALGRRPDGGPWRAAVADPRSDTARLFELPLGAADGAFEALATSAGSGTRFGSDPRLHHLLDPHTGRSANHCLSVTVSAPTAALADGLSTTLSIAAPSRHAALLAAFAPARAWVVDARGRIAPGPVSR